jgi:hypothetical protein
VLSSAAAEGPDHLYGDEQRENKQQQPAFAKLFHKKDALGKLLRRASS